MSFKLGRFFYLTISLVIGTFFLLLGAVSIALPWVTLLRDKIVQFILEGNLIFTLFGLGFFLIGLSILLYSLLSSKKQYVYLRTGNRSITLDEDLIQDYLETYWQERFPKHTIPSSFQIKKRAIHIKADFPFLPVLEQRAFLERIQHDFNDLFGRVLGYPHEIYLTASFQSN
jgi:hypothetical protein